MTPITHSDALSHELYPPKAAAWYALFVFIIAATIGYIDKSIIVLMVQPIRASLAVSDTGISLLHGLSFALIYAVLGIPSGYFVDRHRRREFFAGGVALWSVMTALCGLATNYTELFLARVGVGVGEAVLMPAIFSMLADFFPPAKRGRAAGIFTISTFAGGQGAFIIGGYVLGRLQGQVIDWPLAGALQAWQSAFIIVGLPGLLVAALVMTIREPARQGVAAPRSHGPAVPEPGLLTYLGERRALWACVFGAFSMVAFGAYALLSWLPTYFIRKFGMSAHDAGMLIGSIVGPCGIAGCLVSGVLSDAFRARHGEAGRFYVLLISSAVCLPCMALLPWYPSKALALAGCGLFGLFNAMATAAMPALLQDLAPNRMRGKVTAVHLLLVSLIGMGLGPLTVALLTDRVFHNDAALPWSMSLSILPALLLSAGLTVQAIRRSSRTTGSATPDAAQTTQLPVTRRLA